MEKFSKIYPFATENLNYLKDIDLSHKKVITVSGSGDHILNIILAGSTDILTFDINKKTKYYTKLKIFLIKHISYELYKSLLGLSKRRISLINNSLFERHYFNSERIINQNPYLEETNYYRLRNKLKKAKITYIHSSLENLNITQEYDYMFLSNISDYLSHMYKNDYLYNYQKDINKFLINVKTIYFAYLYDYQNNHPRSDIDNIEKVKQIFKQIKIKKIDTALINSKAKYDALLIIERR